MALATVLVSATMGALVLLVCRAYPISRRHGGHVASEWAASRPGPPRRPRRPPARQTPNGVPESSGIGISSHRVVVGSDVGRKPPPAG
jgi:hypothetical protein